MNSFQLPQIRIDLMPMGSLSLPHSGNAVRELAVRHGLFFNEYPSNVALKLVLLDLGTALTRCDASERRLFLGELKALGDDQQWPPGDQQAIAQSLLTAQSGALPDASSDVLTALHLLNLSYTLQLDQARRSYDQIDALLTTVKLPSSSEELSGLRHAISMALFALDEEQDKGKKLQQLVADVRQSGLRPSDQVTLLEELVKEVCKLTPPTLVASGWRTCLDGLAGIAQAHPGDPALDMRLQEVARTFPALEGVRYPANPMIALRDCRVQMDRAGYPEVAAQLYVASAVQVASMMKKPSSECAIAFSRLLEQIAEAFEAGHSVPLDLLMAVLKPAADAWPSEPGCTVAGCWTKFLARTKF